MMIEFLYEYVGFIGLWFGCGQGICYVCVVIVDQLDGMSEEMCICIIGVYFFYGCLICMIEGYVKCNEVGEVVELLLIQQKFFEYFSFQCGYCMLGFVNVVIVLIECLKCELIVKVDVECMIIDVFDVYFCCCMGYVCYYEVVKDVVLMMLGFVKDVV